MVGVLSRRFAVATRLKKYRSFSDARRFVRGLGLRSNAEWQAIIRNGALPSDIPTTPHRTYAGHGWCSLGDWLGTGEIAPRLREHLPFEPARAFVRNLGLRTQREWQAYAVSGKRPPDIPTNPDKTYAGKGWAGFGDWLRDGSHPAAVTKVPPLSGGTNLRAKPSV
jgi:hypothetical protein